MCIRDRVLTIKVALPPPDNSSNELGLVVPIPKRPLLSKVALVEPPVFILTVSDAKFIPVLLSVPVTAGAEADPSTPEIPVVPLMFKAIIKE